MQWAHSTNQFGMALSAVIVIHTIQIGGIGVIMRSERPMSSVFGLDCGQFSILLRGKKGVEELLPKCVHFHLANSKQGLRPHF